MIIKIAFFTVFLFLFSSVFADSKIECFDGLRVVARFSNKSIFCDTNQFLPANSQNLQCMNCPDGYVCNQEPQTYYFSETKSSGIDYSKIINSASNVCATNMPIRFYASFKIAQRNCNPGYYLPANSVECTKCLNDHYCPGGILTFNETTPQGIIECPENHPFAPAGMWQQSQCGRKLHVGDDILYMHQSPVHPTTHRLFVQYGNTTYSANTVQKSENNIPMSDGAVHSLHIIIDNIEYMVHDDSVE